MSDKLFTIDEVRWLFEELQSLLDREDELWGELDEPMFFYEFEHVKQKYEDCSDALDQIRQHPDEYLREHPVVT
jgi:hypothetical protein